MDFFTPDWKSGTASTVSRPATSDRRFWHLCHYFVWASNLYFQGQQKFILWGGTQFGANFFRLILFGLLLSVVKIDLYLGLILCIGTFIWFFNFHNLVATNKYN